LKGKINNVDNCARETHFLRANVVQRSLPFLYVSTIQNSRNSFALREIVSAALRVKSALLAAKAWLRERGLGQFTINAQTMPGGRMRRGTLNLRDGKSRKSVRRARGLAAKFRAMRYPITRLAIGLRGEETSSLQERQRD